MSAIKFIISLGLGMGSVLAATATLAAPAPVFEPILDEIPTDSGLPSFRIPANVPTDMELYPSITPEAGILYLNTEPDCEDIECTALVVIAQLEPPQNWPFIGADPKKSVDLTDDIEAHFWERRGMASLQWIQGDAFYVMSYSQEIFSEDTAIAMATSMATEPPFVP